VYYYKFIVILKKGYNMMKLQKLSRAEHDRLNQVALLKFKRHAMARKAAGVKPKPSGYLKIKLNGTEKEVFNLG
jgi:hypothetical protein